MRLVRPQSYVLGMTLQAQGVPDRAVLLTCSRTGGRANGLAEKLLSPLVTYFISLGMLLILILLPEVCISKVFLLMLVGAIRG